MPLAARIVLLSLVVALVPTNIAFAQFRGTVHPAFQPHYGCFGYCNGPIGLQHTHWGCFGYCPGPINPRPEPHWGCFGYCPGPLDPDRHPEYWGCFGYCNGPLNPRHHWGCYGYCPGYYPYPVAVPVPYPVSGDTTVVNNTYVQTPSTSTSISTSQEQKQEPAKEKSKSVEDLIKDLSSKQARVRGEAAAALGRLGDKAKEAIPGLILLLKDRDANVRVEATVSLSRIGSAALPSLTKSLGSSDKLTRMGAAFALGHFGPMGKAAEPELKILLKDEQEDVRCHAAQALFRIDPKNASLAAPVLIDALDSRNWTIRQYAIGTLSRIGPPAKDAIPKLKKFLNDEDYHLRLAAAIAIGRIDPSQDQAGIDTLRIALQEKSAVVRMEAAQILGELRVKTEPVLDSLGQSLQDSDAGVSRAAAIALSQIGAEAIPQLEKALKSDNVQARRNAVAALVNLGETARQAIPALRIAAMDRDEAVRLLAENALKNLDEEKK